MVTMLKLTPSLCQDKFSVLRQFRPQGEVYGYNFLSQNAQPAVLACFGRAARGTAARSRRDLAGAVARAGAAADARRSWPRRSRPQPRSDRARGRETLLAGLRRARCREQRRERSILR